MKNTIKHEYALASIKFTNIINKQLEIQSIEQQESIMKIHPNNFISPFGDNINEKNEQQLRIENRLQNNRKNSHLAHQNNIRINKPIKNISINYKSLQNMKQKSKIPEQAPRIFNKKVSMQSTKQKLNKYIQKQKIKPNFIVFQQDANFVPIDPHRVSRYNGPISSQSRDGLNKKDRWEKSIEQYMKARTKMQNYLRQVKKANYQFDSLQLDKKNIILKRQKVLALKGITSRQKCQQKSKKSKQFVSNLISNQKQVKNEMIRTISKNGDIHRCDALLVNFVSTYFRRKFYKKNRRFYTNKTHETQGSQGSGMIGLEGNFINEQVINQYLGMQQMPSDIQQTNRNKETKSLNRPKRDLNMK